MSAILSMAAAGLRFAPLMLALAAIGYTIRAIVAVRRFAHLPRPPIATPEPVTLLKPLHGAEPRLAANLRTFLDQDWPAAVQMVAGTNRADDPAFAVARTLRGDITLRTDASVIGANAKIANLASLLPAASHDVLILSDSDMAVPSDYLIRVTAMLAQPGVGIATCIYSGRADAGFWSRLFAANIDYHFLPSVLVSVALRVGNPCMGSTIAMRRETLEAIGGFAPFADSLADDHAIGEAVRRLGLTVAVVPGLVLTHACSESSWRELLRHELRWHATLRGISPSAHLGSLFTHPLPLALATIPFTPIAGGIATAIALVARLVLARAVDRLCGGRILSPLLLPVRDLLTFAILTATFFTRSVDWRGARLSMQHNGRISAEP